MLCGDDNNTEQAWRRAASLSCWTGPVDPRPLAGGISNSNFVVEDAGRRYAVRIAGDRLEHGVLRGNEVAISQAAHAAGLSPAVRHYETGALVMDFIEGGTSLTSTEAGSETCLPRIVDLVRRCHTTMPTHLSVPGQLFWVFHANRNYARLLADRNTRLTAHLPEFMALNDEFEQAVGPVLPVFAHNDLLASNIIDDGDRLWLVDWEYGGWNTALFDLANLASNNRFGPAMETELLTLYFDTPPNDVLRQRFQAMKAASLLREALWSLVSEQYSHLDFDYGAYTAENLEHMAHALDTFRTATHRP